jgi:hypothetical protein
MSENGKGAAGGNHDAQQKGTSGFIVGANAEYRNLVRRVRRRLKRDRYTLRLISGCYFVVGVHPWRAIHNMRQFADSLGLHACEFCPSHAGTSEIEGMFACAKCVRMLHDQDAEHRRHWRFKKTGDGYQLVPTERRVL